MTASEERYKKGGGKIMERGSNQFKVQYQSDFTELIQQVKKHFIQETRKKRSISFPQFVHLDALFRQAVPFSCLHCYLSQTTSS